MKSNRETLGSAAAQIADVEAGSGFEPTLERRPADFVEVRDGEDAPSHRGEDPVLQPGLRGRLARLVVEVLVPVDLHDEPHRRRGEVDRVGADALLALHPDAELREERADALLLLGRRRVGHLCRTVRSDPIDPLDSISSRSTEAGVVSVCARYVFSVYITNGDLQMAHFSG